MDPYDEQRLRDEVIYLHSLWHRGPPPRSTFTNSSNGVLHQHSKRTQFKRQRLKPSAQRGNRNNTNQEAQCSTISIQDPGKEWPKPNNVAPISAWPTRNAQSNSQLSWHSTESGKEWPCNPSPDASTHTSAWPIVTTQQNSQSISISPQQQARLVANRAQAKALKAAKVFLGPIIVMVMKKTMMTTSEILITTAKLKRMTILMIRLRKDTGLQNIGFLLRYLLMIVNLGITIKRIVKMETLRV